MGQQPMPWTPANEFERWNNFRDTAKSLKMKGERLRNEFNRTYPFASYQSNHIPQNLKLRGVKSIRKWGMFASLYEKENGSFVLTASEC
jgi:hypothetical protein